MGVLWRVIAALRHEIRSFAQLKSARSNEKPNLPLHLAPCYKLDSKFGVKTAGFFKRQSSGLRMNRPLPLSLAIALTVGSSAAQALGLGGITVKSELNEPLRAEIPVFVAGPDEAKSLNAGLATAEEFARVGLNIGSMSVPIKFVVVRNARGEPVIEVSSEQPVREPFLSFILEVNWSNGKLLREYSILLDPPMLAPAIVGSPAAVERLPEPDTMSAEPLDSAVAEVAPVEALPEPEPLPEPEVMTMPEPEAIASEPEAEAIAAAPATAEEEPTYIELDPEPEAQPEAVAVAPAEPATPEPESVDDMYIDPSNTEPPMSSPLAASEYGPVASGETLWEIATTVRSNEAVTLNQMMLALLRANPQAFYQDNINTLKRGAILRIPGAEEIESMRAAQASAEVLNQNRSWIESTRPTMVADAASTSSFSGGSASSGGSNSSRLELVPPASGGVSAGDSPGSASGTVNAATAAELARTKEALNSSNSESRELRDRVKELEALSGKSDRLIELKNSELKALQDRLADAEKRAIDAAASLAAAKGDAATARKLADESAAKAREAQLQADARAAQELSDAKAAEDAKAASDAKAIAATTAADAAASEELSPVSDDPIAGSDASTDVDGEMVDADPIGDGLAEDASADTTSAAEIIPLTDSAPVNTAPPPAVAETPAVVAKPWYKNPMILGGGGLLIAALAALGLVSRRKSGAAAKDVLPRTSIAHNFDDGADAAASGDSVETDLLNALAIDPTDLNAHLNVLEYFYTRRDPDKFEAAAEAMHAQVTDPTVSEWQGALLMGADICPTHPLFSGMDQAAGATDLNDPFADGDFDLQEPQHNEFSAPAMRSDMPTPTSTPAVPAQSFDFEFVEGQQQSHSPDDDLSLDFDLELDTPAISTTMSPVEDIDVPDLTFTQADPASSLNSTQRMEAVPNDFMGDDAVATKIDLARAYLDMGDSEGARSMLEEVLTEGSASQREEAGKLLSEIR